MPPPSTTSGPLSGANAWASQPPVRWSVVTYNTFILADTDLRNLVAVRMIHDYYGVSVELAMARRSGGTGLLSLVSDEYRGRHGKGRGPSHTKANQGHPGKGHGKK